MRKPLKLAISTGSVLFGLLLWTIFAAWTSQPELVPSPLAVGKSFFELASSGELLAAVAYSLQRVFVGYFSGALLGVATGIVLGRVPIFYRCFGLVFEFLKGIPPIALAPIVIIWLGIGEISKYVVIAYIVWIVVAISTTNGAHEIPLIRLRTGKFLGLSSISIFLRIVLPSVAPYILIGLRNAIGFAFVALVSAELIAANTGIGQIIMKSRFSLQTDQMLVGLILLGLLGSSIQIVFDAFIARSSMFRRL